jgi:GxxExxY protein
MSHSNLEDRLTYSVIGAAMEVHRVLGPGLLESAYRKCLGRELQLRGIAFDDEVPVPITYKELFLECGYRFDFLVGNRIVVELKSVEAIAPVHEAQLISYLKLGGYRVGLLINFNVAVLKDGIRRRVLNC